MRGPKSEEKAEETTKPKRTPQEIRKRKVNQLLWWMGILPPTESDLD